MVSTRLVAIVPKLGFSAGTSRLIRILAARLPAGPLILTFPCVELEEVLCWRLVSFVINHFRSLLDVLESIRVFHLDGYVGLACSLDSRGAIDTR